MTSPNGRPPSSRSPCLFRSVEDSRESPLHVSVKCATPPQQPAALASSSTGIKAVDDWVLCAGSLSAASALLCGVGTVTTSRQTVATSVESAQLSGPPPPPPPPSANNRGHPGYPNFSHKDETRLGGESPARAPCTTRGNSVKPPRTPPQATRTMHTHRMHRSRIPTSRGALTVDSEGVVISPEGEPAPALRLDGCEEGCVLARQLSHSSDSYSSAASSSSCASPVSDVVEQVASTRPFLAADQLFQSVAHDDNAAFWGSSTSPAEASVAHGRRVVGAATTEASGWRPQPVVAQAVPFVRRYRSSVQSYSQQNRMLPCASEDGLMQEPDSGSATGPRSHGPSRRRHFGFVCPTSAQSSSTPPSR